MKQDTLSDWIKTFDPKLEECPDMIRVLAHEDDVHEECNSTRSSLVPGKPPP